MMGWRFLSNFLLTRKSIDEKYLQPLKTVIYNSICNKVQNCCLAQPRDERDVRIESIAIYYPISVASQAHEI